MPHYMGRGHIYIYIIIQVVSFYVRTYVPGEMGFYFHFCPSFPTLNFLSPLPQFNFPIPSPPCLLLPPISTAFSSPPPLPPTNSQSTFIFHLQYGIYAIENDYTSTNTHYKFITPPHASINQEHRSLHATSHRLQVFKCTVRRLT